MTMKRSRHGDVTFIEIFCNAIALTCICLLLFAAFVFQFIFRELPCALCLLQRIGFMGAALGFLMNLRFGLRPSHYAVVLVSSIFTSLVALRQIALHVVPGTGVYGKEFIGFHLYTWSFIISMIIVAGTALMLSVDSQYTRMNETPMQRFFWVVHLLFGALLLMIGMNIIALVMQCGISACPETVSQYML
jgi:disulfide bond formation protein DsbB